MNIRTGLTEKDVMINMIELLGFLAEHQDEDVNDIEIEFKGVHLHFEAWTDEQPCDCYHVDSDIPRCYGTKEMDICSCNGDKNKCDFY